MHIRVTKTELFLLFGLLIQIILVFYFIPNTIYKDKHKHFSAIKLNDTSLDYISEKIIEFDIQHPDVVLAQSILESQVYKKDIIKNNNLFGMKSAWVRQTVALNPRKYEYAKYASIDSSILDYKLWQIQYANNLTRQQYLLKLQQIYASDTLYVKKLLNIIKNESRFRNFKR